MTAPLPEQAEFAPYFRSHQVRFGQDEALMRRIYELRFQIYCQERGFLPAANYPDGLESDQYDASAAHFCTFNLKDELVGYVRLVHPSGSQTFPFQSHCATLLEGVTLPPPSQSAEVSRLIVHHDYRRRRGDTLAGVNLERSRGTPDHEMRSQSPQILLSLYRQIYAFSRTNGIRYWYAAMERNLARILTQLNFDFRPIGRLIDYYGPVTPYLADLHKTEAKVGKRQPELLAWMQRPEPMETE